MCVGACVCTRSVRSAKKNLLMSQHTALPQCASPDYCLLGVQCLTSYEPFSLLRLFAVAYPYFESLTTRVATSLVHFSTHPPTTPFTHSLSQARPAARSRIEPRREVRRELPKKAPKPPPKDPAIVYTSTTCTVTTTTPPATSTATKDSKKVRRKLPPIPVGEEPILASKTKLKRPKPPARKTDSSPRLSPPSAPPRTTSPLPRQPPPPPRQQQQQQPLVVAPELEKHLQQRQYDVALSRKPPQQQQQQQQQPQQFTRQTPQLSPTLQQLPPPMPALHQPLLQRGAEDALNEEDMEVAQITTKVQDKRKVPLGDIMKSKSIESSDPTRSRDRTRAGGLEAPGGYSLQRAASVGSGGSSSSTFGSSSMDETDAIIDALINIYGIPITEAMKSLKRRLQEELRRVTRDRKRKLEELEEIRALQMQIGALRLEGDAYKLSRHGASGSDKRAPSYVNITVESKKALTPRSSPQVTPRRQRHKRQSSDPMISKFSPIKEDKDIEADFPDQTG
ncbi:hypothetical protein C0Q70_15625 [Pomacea canaliculata]|uniref:Uncharacterized protein n=1 Tax=Pomacea canaliculata TaxID=400727 RepID=A0A2T7NVC9_POMCA|nr:hypothetical protein C0Q70_15625 [Pomacea canaliculata]